MRIPKPERRGPKPKRAIKRSKLAKKPRHSRKKAVLYADSLWSQIVRRREGGCVSGRATHAGGFQAAHGFSRRYHGTRWNLRNGLKLCAGCHVYYTHRPLEWDEWLRAAWGADGYDSMRLAALAGARHGDAVDLAGVTAALEAVLHTGVSSRARPRFPESIYCPCCGGGIVECGCTWRPDHYCMKHAQWCPPRGK